MSPDLLAQQDALAAYIRDPANVAPPPGIEERRLKIYRDLFFNNISAMLAGNFPVLRWIYGDTGWALLMRAFYRDHHSHTPLFTELPRELLRYLETRDALGDAAWLRELAHYEWIELAISSQQTRPQSIQQTLSTESNYLDDVITLAPASALLAYDYPVHKISKRFKPTTFEKTYLLVFRNINFDVKFIVLNPVTYNLLSLIQPQPLTGRLALTMLANKLQHPDLALFMRFGAEILDDLYEQQAITLSQNTLTINVPPIASAPHPKPPS